MLRNATTNNPYHRMSDEGPESPTASSQSDGEEVFEDALEASAVVLGTAAVAGAGCLPMVGAAALTAAAATLLAAYFRRGITRRYRVKPAPLREEAARTIGRFFVAKSVRDVEPNVLASLGQCSKQMLLELSSENKEVWALREAASWPDAGGPAPAAAAGASGGGQSPTSPPQTTPASGVGNNPQPTLGSGKTSAAGTVPPLPAGKPFKREPLINWRFQWRDRMEDEERAAVGKADLLAVGTNGEDDVPYASGQSFLTRLKNRLLGRSAKTYHRAANKFSKRVRILRGLRDEMIFNGVGHKRERNALNVAAAEELAKRVVSKAVEEGQIARIDSRWFKQALVESYFIKDDDDAWWASLGEAPGPVRA